MGQVPEGRNGSEFWHRIYIHYDVRGGGSKWIGRNESLGNIGGT